MLFAEHTSYHLMIRGCTIERIHVIEKLKRNMTRYGRQTRPGSISRLLHARASFHVQLQANCCTI
jgi:hypothetical protein